MGCLICVERKPTSSNPSTANGLHSKSRQDHSTLKKRTSDVVPKISKSDKSASRNDVTLYESVKCVTSKKSHNNTTSCSISDEKSYAKVLSVKGNLSTNDSRTYETVRSFEADSQSVSTCTRVGTQYASTDQLNVSAVDVRNTEQYTEQCCNGLQDMCALCASSNVAEQATHICLTCSTFGRYFCYKCIHAHNKFKYGHDVRSLSGSAYCNSQNTERIESRDDRIHSYDERYLEVHIKHGEQYSNSGPKTEIRSQNAIIRPERAQHCRNKMANLPNEETYRNYKTAEWIKNEVVSWSCDRPAVQGKERTVPYEPHYHQKMPSSKDSQHKQYILMSGDNTTRDLFHEQANETSKSYVRQSEVSTRHHDTVGNTDKQFTRKSESHNLQNAALRAEEIVKRSDKAKNLYNAETTTNEATSHERHSPKFQHLYQVERNVDPSRATLTRRHESVNRSNKISKQFSELYNKEWTEGFNALVHADKGNKTERQACEILLRVLITIYLMCKEKTTTNLQSKASVSSREKTDQPSAASKDDRSELHNNLKEITGEVFKSFGETLSRQDRLLIAKYINRCSGVCLLMTIKEPRVGMDTDIDRNGQDFDVRRYKAYKPPGTVTDYIIWPALYLDDNHTILNKGIVQVKKLESYT